MNPTMRLLPIFLLGLSLLVWTPTAQAGTTYTISPSDSFSSKLAQLQPGDTLILRDGTYSPISIDCNSNAQNGTASAPITLQAEHERQALIMPSGDKEDAFGIYNCSYWNIEGLHMKGLASAACPITAGVLISVRGSAHINIRRNLVDHLNPNGNLAAIFIGYGSHDSLVEENEIYDLGVGSCSAGCHCNNKAIQIYNSTNVVVRRNYVNERNDRSQVLEDINPYPASQVLVENNIVENGGLAFSVDPNAYGANSNDNQFYGNIALKASLASFFWAARCHDLNPCDGTGGGIIKNNSYKDNVSIDSAYEGMYDRGAWGNTIESFTDINSADRGYLYDVQSDSAYTITQTNIVNFLSTGPGDGGFYVSRFTTPPFTFSCDHCVANGKAINFIPALPDSHFTNALSIDPQLGSCKVWIPENSPMKRAGKNGADIGANVLYRYQDGVLTNQPLWDPVTGRFPCGAIVPGINDVPGQSCVDVHQRLNVNTNGCPFPTGYGGTTLRGDLDGNGQRDLADVRLLIYMLLGQQATTPEADLTNDGAVTLADVQALIRLLVGVP